jgi:hypothetical protein
MIDGRDGCISGAFGHLTVLTVAIQDGTVENGRREVSAWGKYLLAYSCGTMQRLQVREFAS